MKVQQWNIFFVYSSEFEEEKTVVPSLQIKNPDLIIWAVVKARKSRLKKMSMEISVLKKMGLLLLQWLLAWWNLTTRNLSHYLCCDLCIAFLGRNKLIQVFGLMVRAATLEWNLLKTIGQGDPRYTDWAWFMHGQETGCMLQTHWNEWKDS